MQGYSTGTESNASNKKNSNAQQIIEQRQNWRPLEDPDK